jgi:glycosyltransferase involved in cell wall biosynthesis
LDLWAKILRYEPKLTSYLKEDAKKFDLFVIHGSYQYPAYATSKCCREVEIPYIFVPHGSLDPAVRAKHRVRNRFIDFVYHDDVIRGAAAWHFTSDREQARCERKLWRHAFVEPLGFDLASVPETVEAGRFRQRYEIPITATLLLFLSRITRKKGIDILLEAFRRNAETNRNLYLALCGPLDKDMAKLVGSFRRIPNVGERIILTGFLSGHDKDAALIDADYFILPTYSENFGIAVFEALAYGAPVITTTGMDLWAELAKCGRVKIVEPNADALTAVVKEVSDSEWRPASDTDQVRNWIETNYSWRARAANLIDHYAEVLKRLN